MIPSESPQSLGPSDGSGQGVQGSPRGPNGRGIGRGIVKVIGRGESMRMGREEKEGKEGEGEEKWLSWAESENCLVHHLIQPMSPP
jgi:hypothetical protein